MLSNWLWISRCGDYWQQAELRTDGACRIMMNDGGRVKHTTWQHVYKLTRVCLYMEEGDYTLHSGSCISPNDYRHGLNVSSERLETLFWTSRLDLVSMPSLQHLGLDTPKSRSCLGLETLTSRSHLGLGIIRLIYNPEMDAVVIEPLSWSVGLQSECALWLSILWSCVQLKCCGVYNHTNWYKSAAWPGQDRVPRECCRDQNITNCHTRPELWYKKVSRRSCTKRRLELRFTSIRLQLIIISFIPVNNSCTCFLASRQFLSSVWVRLSILA